MGNIRDFSAEAIEIMCSRVDEDPGNFWGGADGFLDNIWDALRGEKSPKFTEKGNNLKAYFRNVLERNDIYGEQLIKILHDVWDVEGPYGSDFKNVDECLGGQNTLLVSLIEAITPDDFIINFDIIDMYNKIGDTVYSYDYTIEQLNALYAPIIKLLRATGATDIDRIRTVGDLSRLLHDIEEYNKKHPDNPITLPVPPEMLEEIERYREQLEAGWSIDVDNYRQRDFAYPEYEPGFGASACYATCILVIARYFGFDISMHDLINGGNVRGSDGYVYHTEPYFKRTSKLHGASPSVYGPEIKEQLARGNAVIITYNGGGHYVVVTEVRGDGTSTDDIIIMEPITGTEMPLSKSMKDYGYYYSNVQVCEPY